MAPRFLGAYLALFGTFAIITPYLQVLLANLGFDRQEVGAIQGTIDVLAVLAPPLWGVLSDRWQRPRDLLVCSVLGAIPAFLLFALTRNTIAAVGVGILFGIFYRPQIALTDGLTFSYIHDHSGQYGPPRTGGSVSFILVILILEAIGISGAHGTVIILAAFSVLALVHAVAVSRLPQQRREADAGNPPTRTNWRAFLRRAFLLFVVAAFLGRLAMMSYYHFFTLFLKEEFGFQHPGIIWVLGPVSEIPIIFFSDRIMRRIGVRRLFALGLLAIGVRVSCYGFVTNVWQVVPLQFLHALTFGAYHTASVTFVSRHAPPHMKSSAQTCFAAVTVGLGGLCGGLLGGWLAEAYGFAVLYRVFGLIGFAGLAVLLLGVPADE